MRNWKADQRPQRPHCIEIALGVAVVVVAAVVGAAQVIIIHRQTELMSTQAQIMSTQAEIAKGQLSEMQIEQRPWLHNKEMPKMTKFAYLPNGNIDVEMNIDIENVGHTPALDASVRMMIKVGNLPLKNLRNDICGRGESREVGGGLGVSIFPNASVPQGLSDSINKDDITVEKVGTSFVAYVVGCIAYRSAEGTAYHHTPFACYLALKGPGGGIIPGGIPLQKREFNADEFVCLQLPVAALYRVD